MDGKLLTFLMVVCATSNAVALQCHICGLTGFCEKGKIGEPQNCTTGTPGLVKNLCIKTDGEVSGDVGGYPFPLKGIFRGCLPLPGSIAPPIRCSTGSEASALYRELFSNITFTGDICLCETDNCNGVDSLKPFIMLILTVGLVHLLM